MAREVASELLDSLEIAAAVRAHEVSAAEVTQSCLDRIHLLDQDLHAFQLVRGDRALEEAKQLDRRNLDDLPLAGVPVSIKDAFDVAGEPTRNGSAGTNAVPAEKDDELVTRLRDAGAIVIGKTALPELAIFGFTESEAFGITRNPWNRERSPGGSSGGAAVAAATSMSPLALGTDGLGSLRIPACFCGIFGIKPSRGRIPMPAAAAPWFGLGSPGPLAFSVREVALMLDILAGTKEFREVRPPAKKLRIALSLKSPSFLTRAAPEVADGVRKAAAALEHAGHEVTESDPPYKTTLANHVIRWWTAGVEETTKGLDRARLEKRTRTMAGIGRRIGPAPMAAMEDWIASASAWFLSFDVALMPVVARPSVPAGGWTGRGFTSTLWSQIRALPYTAAWNVAGFPAASVPVGIGKDGVPLGVQVVAPAQNESLVLSVAAQLEQLRPWQRLRHS